MKEKTKLNILVTNDDGIDSPGILALANRLKEIGNVIVVAPDRQQSAVGHSLTVANPLRVTPFRRDGSVFGYAINGTPSDCVKLAVSAILKEKPDMVVSGINHGQNTAINVLYSGTVSAATEGMLLGIPSMAVSLCSHSYEADMTGAADWALKIAKRLFELKLPNDTVLNVNVPNISADKIKGCKVVRLSDAIWDDYYERRLDPYKREYFWFAGDYKLAEGDIDTDDSAIVEGYVALTPIHFKFTNTSFLKKMKHIEDII